MRRMRTRRDTVKTSSVKYSGIAIHLKTLFLTSYAMPHRRVFVGRIIAHHKFQTTATTGTSSQMCLPGHLLLLRILRGIISFYRGVREEESTHGQLRRIGPILLPARCDPALVTIRRDTPIVHTLASRQFKRPSVLRPTLSALSTSSLNMRIQGCGAHCYASVPNSLQRLKRTRGIWKECDPVPEKDSVLLRSPSNTIPSRAFIQALIVGLRRFK